LRTAVAKAVNRSALPRSPRRGRALGKALLRFMVEGTPVVAGLLRPGRPRAILATSQEAFPPLMPEFREAYVFHPQE
jgi:hypothetical protein